MKKSRMQIKAYQAWGDMIRRCMNKKHAFYKLYGARGISVCDHWFWFENFVADLGLPRPGMTLDRKDNNGNYEPDNCRWATPEQQAQNRRDTRMLTHDGMTLCIREWERRLCFGYGTIWSRLHSGLSVDEALSPTKRKSGGDWRKFRCV